MKTAHEMWQGLREKSRGRPKDETILFAMNAYSRSVAIEFVEFCFRHPRKVQLPDGEYEPMSARQLFEEFQRNMQ